MARPKGPLTREQVIAHLVTQGARRDTATMYADAFVEYREACENIAAHGTIVEHPRTGNPIENPFLVIRDRALAKLRRMPGVKADGLW